MDSFPQPEIEQPDRKTVKEFSKKRSPDERKKLAAELWSKRKDYFDRSQRRDAIIDALVDQAESREIDAQEASRRIQEIESILRERKESIIQSLLYHFDSKKLEQEKNDLEASVRDLLSGAARLAELRKEVEQQYVDRETLSKARGKLTEFYGSQESAWVEYQEAEQTRDVTNVMKEKDVYVVHGIQDFFAPDTNSLLRYGETIETKLMVLLAFDPTLSTSTIKKGDTNRNMWSRVGVLLNGGRVLSAHGRDAATVATGLKSRTSGFSPDRNIKEDIERAIKRERFGVGGFGYNELVVENPRVAGLYICLDVDESEGEHRPISVERMLEASRLSRLPLYAMQKGIAYEMDYDFDPESLKPQKDDFSGHEYPPRPYKRAFFKSPVSPDAMLAKDSKITPEQRTAFAEEIFENSPFRPRTREAGFVSQLVSGREIYVDLFLDDVVQKLPGSVTEYAGTEKLHFDHNRQRYIGYEPGYPRKGDKVEIIDTFVTPEGRTNQVLRFQGTIFEYQSWPRMGQLSGDEKSIDEFRQISKDPFMLGSNYRIDLNIGGCDLGEPLNKETFLDAVARLVPGFRDDILRFQSDGELSDELQERFIKDRELAIAQVAYYLYGFGQEAEKFEDQENRDKAWKLAAEILPLEQIRDVIKRRVNEKGGFRITKDDLEK